MSRRKEISVGLWKHIKPLLPEVKPSPKDGRPGLDDERTLNGLLFVLRTGIPREDLPQELGYGSGMICTAIDVCRAPLLTAMCVRVSRQQGF